MKRVFSLLLAVIYALFSMTCVAFAADKVAPVVSDAGWTLDFSGAADGAAVPFTLTNATASVSGGALQVVTSAKGPRLVYNGGDFSVNADEITEIVIVQKTATGKYFQPYLYFGGSFNGTNVFKGKAIPGTGDWQEIVINTNAMTIYTGSTNCTGDMPSGLNWSGTLNAFRLDNANQTSGFDIKSISFRKPVADNKIDGVESEEGWSLDFTNAADGSEVKGTIRNATVSVSGGALNFTPTTKDPGYTTVGTNFAVNAENIKEIRVMVKLPSNASAVTMYFFPKSGGTKNFGSIPVADLTDVGDGWKEYVINTASSADWTGDIASIRFDVDTAGTTVGQYSIRYIKLLKNMTPGKIDGEFTDEGWILDYSNAEDGSQLLGTLRNATAEISGGALVFTPSSRDPGYTSAGTNFSVSASDIKQIRVALKLPANASAVTMYFTTSAGTKNFGSIPVGDLIPAEDGWSECVIDTSSSANWTGTISTFRFDVDTTGTIVGQYSIKYIKFLKYSGAVAQRIEGVKDGKNWYIDFTNAADGAIPVINSNGDEGITTNATYVVKNGALEVTPSDSSILTPRVALSNRSNFSVSPADIDRIVFKVRSSTVVKTPQLFFTTASGSFNHGRIDGIIGDKDANGWQDIVFYPHKSVGWDAVSGDIAKFRFDLTLRKSQTYEVQSIRFENIADNEQAQCAVSFDGSNNTTVAKRGTVSAPATNPTKSGYTFYGWAVKGTSDKLTFPRIITGDTEFVSLWIADRFVEAGKSDLRTWRFYDTKTPAKDYAYSFCVVGDTQDIIDEHSDKFHYIYDWILNNKDDKKIEFVFGMGDITQNGSVDAEWQVAQDHISRLDGEIPYTLVRGSENHDATAKFNEYFNTPAYTNTLEGFYNETEINNVWRTFSVGGVDYLFMVLDFGPSDAVLEWAGDVIEQHPYHRVIISTHCYLNTDGTTVDYSDPSPPHKTEVGDGTKNNGDEMWDKLVSKYENIFMVLSGHESSDKIIMTQAEGIHGNVVTQMLVDHQRVDNADTPAGIVAMLYFSEDGESVEVECISTIEEMYYMPENQFTFDIAPYQGATCIKSYSGDSAVVYAREAGTYSVIFVDYENDNLNNAEIVEVTLSAGETKTVARKNTSYTLGAGDMVLMWKDMTNIIPACEGLLITK